MKKSLLLLPICLLLASCTIEKSYTPLEYCLNDVLYNQDYDWVCEDTDLTYMYQEIYMARKSVWATAYDKEHNVKSIYCYEISIYNEETDYVDVWYCGIGFKVGKKSKYKPSENAWIDCDWIYSIPIENTLLGVRDY